MQLILRPAIGFQESGADVLSRRKNGGEILGCQGKLHGGKKIKLNFVRVVRFG